jgi:hypothetical protein
VRHFGTMGDVLQETADCVTVWQAIAFVKDYRAACADDAIADRNIRFAIARYIHEEDPAEAERTSQLMERAFVLLRWEALLMLVRRRMAATQLGTFEFERLGGRWRWRVAPDKATWSTFETPYGALVHALNWLSTDFRGGPGRAPTLGA